MSHSLFTRVRARFTLASEAGFTLIEVIVAAGIMLTVLLALAYTTTVALSYTSFSRQRQGASGLMNQAMEQVAALPFTTLESGLDNTDLANSVNAGSASYDPDIHTTGCGGASGYCYGGEPIPHGNIVGTGQPACSSTSLPHPLVPHSCPTMVGPTSYTVRVYVTNYVPPGGTLDLTSHTYRVTVSVSWAPPQVRGSSKETTQKIFFSSTGCLSSGTHPFAAPCQPFLYATAGVQPGVIQVSGSIGTTALDPGAAIEPLEFSSDLQIEQITALQGYSQTAAASATTAGESVGAVGPLKVTSGADSDPAQPGHEYSSNTSTAALSGSPIDLSGENGHLSLSATGTDSLTTVSTTAAAASQSPACANVSGTNQSDGQPCGNSKVTAGVTTSVSLTLNPAGVSLGAVLGSIATATGTDVAYTKRLVAPSGTVCPTTSGDGCVHAEATRLIGTVTLGSLPSGVSPNGSWLGYLVQITGFSDHVTAEAGVGFAAPAATATGTIRYWTGNGYATCTISSSCPATITTTAVTVTTSDGAAITIPSATLTVGVPSTATSASNCTTPCVFRSAASPSPLTGDIAYGVAKDGVSLANLTIHVNMGELDAKATYKPVTAS
jgi:type II secretory pathway pseudopilin PulG